MSKLVNYKKIENVIKSLRDSTDLVIHFSNYGFKFNGLNSPIIKRRSCDLIPGHYIPKLIKFHNYKRVLFISKGEFKSINGNIEDVMVIEKLPGRHFMNFFKFLPIGKPNWFNYDEIYNIGIIKRDSIASNIFLDYTPTYYNNNNNIDEDIDKFDKIYHIDVCVNDEYFTIQKNLLEYFHFIHRRTEIINNIKFTVSIKNKIGSFGDKLFKFDKEFEINNDEVIETIKLNKKHIEKEFGIKIICYIERENNYTICRNQFNENCISNCKKKTLTLKIRSNEILDDEISEEEYVEFDTDSDLEIEDNQNNLNKEIVKTNYSRKLIIN